MERNRSNVLFAPYSAGKLPHTLPVGSQILQVKISSVVKIRLQLLEHSLVLVDRLLLRSQGTATAARLTIMLVASERQKVTEIFSAGIIAIRYFT